MNFQARTMRFSESESWYAQFVLFGVLCFCSFNWLLLSLPFCPWCGQSFFPVLFLAVLFLMLWMLSFCSFLSCLFFCSWWVLMCLDALEAYIYTIIYVCKIHERKKMSRLKHNSNMFSFVARCMIHSSTGSLLVLPIPTIELSMQRWQKTRSICNGSPCISPSASWKYGEHKTMKTPNFVGG